MQPKFPITVFFEETGEEWVFADEIEAACTLEWFDSDDPEERASVHDSNNHPVRLKVCRLEVITLALMNG